MLFSVRSFQKMVAAGLLLCGATSALASDDAAPSQDSPRKRKREQSEMTLTFEGITGYKDEKFVTKPIQVLAWSFGLSARENGFNMQDISLTKFVGSESPHLMKMLSLGQKIKKATLQVNNASKTVLVMDDAVIDSVSMGGSGGEDRFTENISVSFKSLKYLYETEEKEEKISTQIELSQSDSEAHSKKRLR